MLRVFVDILSSSLYAVRTCYKFPQHKEIMREICITASS